jgi:hypothetical protein
LIFEVFFLSVIEETPNFLYVAQHTWLKYVIILKVFQRLGKQILQLKTKYYESAGYRLYIILGMEKP